MFKSLNTAILYEEAINKVLHMLTASYDSCAAKGWEHNYLFWEGDYFSLGQDSQTKPLAIEIESYRYMSVFVLLAILTL